MVVRKVSLVTECGQLVLRWRRETLAVFPEDRCCTDDVLASGAGSGHGRGVAPDGRVRDELGNHWIVRGEIFEAFALLMKWGLTILFGLALPIASRAHVGSPDTFFEGRAGAVPISVVVPPPPALPGAAHVSITANDASVQDIRVQTWMWPKPADEKSAVVKAERVPGTTNLWTAEVWMLRPGAYTVRVTVKAANESGEALVPLSVLPLGGQPMSMGLRVALALGGMMLLGVGAGVVSGIVRSSGGMGGRAMAVTLLLLTAGAGAVGKRWYSMDAVYQESGISKPAPVEAVVRKDGERTRMEVHPGTTNTAPWTALVPDHGKLMHLFLIKMPNSDVLAHLHPMPVDGWTFGTAPPTLPGGEYEVYGEVTYRSGISQSMLGKVTLPAVPGAAFELSPVMTNMDVWCGSIGTNAIANGRDMDDSWHVGQGNPRSVPMGLGIESPLMGGYSLLFENAAAVSAGKDATMRFAVFDPTGREVPLQAYMGMIGHALVRRKDGSVIAHLHPGGSYSMAALDVSRAQTGAANATADPLKDSNRVAFPYRFPKGGDYRVWVQLRVTGRVLTGVFDITVKP